MTSAAATLPVVTALDRRVVARRDRRPIWRGVVIALGTVTCVAVTAGAVTLTAVWMIGVGFATNPNLKATTAAAREMASLARPYGGLIGVANVPAPPVVLARVADPPADAAAPASKGRKGSKLRVNVANVSVAAPNSAARISSLDSGLIFAAAIPSTLTPGQPSVASERANDASLPHAVVAGKTLAQPEIASAAAKPAPTQLAAAPPAAAKPLSLSQKLSLSRKLLARLRARDDDEPLSVGALAFAPANGPDHPRHRAVEPLIANELPKGIERYQERFKPPVKRIESPGMPHRPLPDRVHAYQPAASPFERISISSCSSL